MSDIENLGFPHQPGMPPVEDAEPRALEEQVQVEEPPEEPGELSEEQVAAVIESVDRILDGGGEVVIPEGVSEEQLAFSLNVAIEQRLAETVDKSYAMERPTSEATQTALREAIGLAGSGQHVVIDIEKLLVESGEVTPVTDDKEPSETPSESSEPSDGESSPERPPQADVRAWAASVGVELPPRGQLKNAYYDAYATKDVEALKAAAEG